LGMRRAYPAAPDRDRRTPLLARGAYDALVGRDAYTGGCRACVSTRWVT
jgi:hypothetical protein